MPLICRTSYRQYMTEPAEKIKNVIKVLYGTGVARYVPKDIRFEYSRTGRIRSVYKDTTLLCTLRPDGGLALGIPLAQMLLSSSRFLESCVEISADAVPFVKEGRSVFAKHVVRCGSNVAVSADTPVIYQGRVIAIGRAVLGASMLAGCSRGVAIRVRKGLKGREVMPET